MQEDFLHYVWQYLHLGNDLKTTSGSAIIIKQKGSHNLETGADFFNAKIQIEEQLWAGNVEIHLKSSDWYAHNHQEDKNYDNVILHVVWQHDTEIYRKDNSLIPTLELKGLVPKVTLENYDALFNKKQEFINCEQQLKEVDSFVKNNWLQRLYYERLEEKAIFINTLLTASNTDWEAVLFQLLLKNFGLKTNGSSFLNLAQNIPFGVFRKEWDKLEVIEALLFGQAGLLTDDKNDNYYLTLQKEYNYYKHKYKLKAIGDSPQFFRLRPPNFPTIRLSQLAMLYYKEKQLVAKIMALKTLEDAYVLFDVKASSYWDTHYNFDVSSKKRAKKLTKSFVELVLINTIIPFQFMYKKVHQTGLQDFDLKLIQAIQSEKNSIVDRFATLGLKAKNAQESQALIQLKKYYCQQHKCLSCAIGNALLKAK